jgi:hypothetical protein
MRLVAFACFMRIAHASIREMGGVVLHCSAICDAKFHSEIRTDSLR